MATIDEVAAVRDNCVRVETTLRARESHVTLSDTELAADAFLQASCTALGAALTAASLPGGSPTALQAVVSDGQALVIGPTTYTFTVAGGVITNIAVAP